ncbi:hypothetical protein [Agrobacterium tumefaciens]|uniref:hypothetical protein n=1 Tax=Agrobacterium tumefaciens TaxID=358 RepID=UPI0015735BF2|nr:hypothetical protein [Agrobacterium tumefaciens]
MNVQRYYWDTFSTLKRDQIYITLQVEKLDNIERCLNIFAAIASSTAIAGWALWQHASFMWACIIALSQVYSAAKPHLPFGLRLRSLHNLAPDIEALTLSAERDWFRVSRGELTEDEIIDRATAIKEKKVQATQKHLKGVVLPEQGKLTELADTKATAYMKNFMEE